MLAPELIPAIDIVALDLIVAIVLLNIWRREEVKKDTTPPGGMTYQEIADRLGNRRRNARSCVKVQAQRAIRKLWMGATLRRIQR